MLNVPVPLAVRGRIPFGSRAAHAAVSLYLIVFTPRTGHGHDGAFERSCKKMARARDALARIMRAHECFCAFCSEKEALLGIVAHALPNTHPLCGATTRALVGDPLAAFRLYADDACCRLCDALGDAAFEEKSGRACTEFFYGCSSRALVAGGTRATPPARAGSLTLGEWCRFVDLPSVAERFMTSARALPGASARRLDANEARFCDAWRKVMLALRGVRVDLQEVLVIHMILRRVLPGDIATLVLGMYVRFPSARHEVTGPCAQYSCSSLRATAFADTGGRGTRLPGPSSPCGARDARA